MTFTIRGTVEKATVGLNGAVDVSLSAFNVVGDEVVYVGDQQLPQISSNTEGNILEARILLVIEGAAAPLHEGDVVQFSGSFTRAPSDISTPTPPAVSTEVLTVDEAQTALDAANASGNSEAVATAQAALDAANAALPTGSADPGAVAAASAAEAESAAAELAQAVTDAQTALDAAHANDDDETVIEAAQEALDAANAAVAASQTGNGGSAQ